MSLLVKNSFSWSSLQVQQFEKQLRIHNNQFIIKGMAKGKRHTRHSGRWARLSKPSPGTLLSHHLCIHQPGCSSSLQFSWCIIGHWNLLPILLVTSLVALGLALIMKLSRGQQDSQLILNLYIAEKGLTHQRSIHYLYHWGNLKF